MTSTLNGEARTAAKTASDYIAAAEKALDYAGSSDSNEATFHVARAQVFATLAVAAADIAIEKDEARLCGCVPDGSESLSVSVRGR